MIPSKTIEELILKHSTLEKDLSSGNLDNKSYEALRLNHPLVDDIEFRRILGMSETISAWTWPEIETIDAVSATLRDRIKQLDVDIKNIEENARIYATSAEGLAKFKRDAKFDRKNFINTQYVLFQLLRRHKYMCKKQDFNILKTIDRKSFHDDICKELFEELGWNFTAIF